jgi:plastocyanin
MIWPSHTLSKFISAGLLIGFVQMHVVAATIAGSVQSVGSRGRGARKNKDLSGVVVWLERRDGAMPPLMAKTVQMAQKNKSFEPPVLAIPVGSTVTFPNFDPIFHNAFSNFSGQIFDVGLYPPGNVPKVRFQRAGIVRVFCNIHPAMSAVIAVLDTPYIAVSNAEGAVAINHVAAGEYVLRVFHDRSTEESLKALEMDLTIGAQDITLPPMQVSESNYIQVPHKNKYGREYPPVVDVYPMDPGGRKP